MACIDAKPANPGNFLRWHRASGVDLPFRGCLGLCHDDGPAGATFYDYRNDDYPTYLPAVTGDTFKFFFNSVAPLDFSNFTLAVGMIRDGKRVTAGFSAAVTPINYGSGAALRQRFFGSLAFESLPDGWYHPYLYDVAKPEHVLYLANAVRVVNYSKWERETVFAKFRAEGSLGGVDYALCPADFYQQFRIPFSEFRPDYPETSTDYTDRNGSTRTTELRLRSLYTLGSDLITQYDYEAAVLMLAHYELYLDGNRRKRSGALEVVDYYDDSNVLTVRGKVEDPNFSRILSRCR